MNDTVSRPAASSEAFYLSTNGHQLGPYTVPELQGMARAGQLRARAEVHRATDGEEFTARDIPWVFSDRSWLVATLLSVLVGVFGIDRFYLGHTGLGIAKLLTVGGLGLWALADAVFIGLRMARDADGRPLR